MTPEPVSDEELMAVLAQGSDEALETLLERHRERVLGFLRGIAGGASPVEDLLQETFVRVFRARSRYRSTSRFSAWLLAIARNVARDYLRGKRRSPAEKNLAPLPGNSATSTAMGKIPGSLGTPSELVSQQEFAALVHEALSRLSLADREAILLVEFEGLTLREAGEAVGTNLKTLASRLSRGKERLRGMLGPFLAGQSPGGRSRS